MKTVDISKYINADAPQFTLFGKTYTVKNDKKTMLLLTELQRRSQAEEDNQGDEKILKLLVGDAGAKEIMEFLDNAPNYSENLQAIMLNVMALASGKSYEEMVERFQKATK